MKKILIFLLCFGLLGYCEKEESSSSGGTDSLNDEIDEEFLANTDYAGLWKLVETDVKDGQSVTETTYMHIINASKMRVWSSDIPIAGYLLVDYSYDGDSKSIAGTIDGIRPFGTEIIAEGMFDTTTKDDCGVTEAQMTLSNISVSGNTMTLLDPTDDNDDDGTCTPNTETEEWTKVTDVDEITPDFVFPNHTKVTVEGNAGSAYAGGQVLVFAMVQEDEGGDGGGDPTMTISIAPVGSDGSYSSSLYLTEDFFVSGSSQLMVIVGGDKDGAWAASLDGPPHSDGLAWGNSLGANGPEPIVVTQGTAKTISVAEEMGEIQMDGPPVSDMADALSGP